MRHDIYRANDFAGRSGSANHDVPVLVVVADLPIIATADGSNAKRTESIGDAWADELSAAGAVSSANAAT
jgi:hypothetical protein